MTGDKRYELSNHLGNVLVVINDKKIPEFEKVDTPESGLVAFNADVLSYSDYYPFGMLQDARHGSKANYRYGFNGMEKDDELKGEGNSYDFGARMLDPRVGRWFSRDPLEKEFPWQSTYSFANNNPIIYNDPTGESGEITINEKTKTVTVTSVYAFYGSGSSPKIAKQYAEYIQKMYNDAHGKVKIDGKMYNVQFKIVGVDISKYGDKAVRKVIERNEDIRKNFVRLEDISDEVWSGTSYTDGQGANTGYWSTSQIQKNNGTTAAHEHNHSLGGLDHPEELNPKGGNLDEEPTIDMTINSYNFVKPKYRVLEEGKRMKIDIAKRKVTQKNIDSFFTKEVINDLKKTGKANLGKLTNEYHDDK